VVNSRLGRFSATPRRYSPQGVPLLPKLRGHFAEFLNEDSPVRLRILSLPTCVGLRYGHFTPSLEAFLDSVGAATSLLEFHSPSPLRLHTVRFFLYSTLTAWAHFSIRALGLPSCVTPSSNGRAVVPEYQPASHRLRISASA
jgi:hypothetical protein